jgi:hypothetical protein
MPMAAQRPLNCLNWTHAEWCRFHAKNAVRDGEAEEALEWLARAAQSEIDNEPHGPECADVPEINTSGPCSSPGAGLA